MHIDLNRKIGSRIVLFIQRGSQDLGVAKRTLRKRLANPLADSFPFITVHLDIAALPAIHQNSTGILAQRIDPFGRDNSVTQQFPCHILLVPTAFRIVQNAAKMLEVFRAKVVCHLDTGQPSQSRKSSHRDRGPLQPWGSGMFAIWICSPAKRPSRTQDVGNRQRINGLATLHQGSR